MFVPETDISEWKDSLKDYDVKRKTVTWKDFEPIKPKTWKDVKQKEIEYNPILQKYSNEQEDRDDKMRESTFWKVRTEEKMRTTNKWAQGYDIITNELDKANSPDRNLTNTKLRVVPASQVDYDIITHNRLDDIYFKNIKINGELKKTYSKRANLADIRDFNIISNMYGKDHNRRAEEEQEAIRQEMKQRFDKTHQYNPVVGQFYDSNKEAEFQEMRKTQNLTHGLNFSERFPPSIKNREQVTLDPTKELPDTMKRNDIQKENSKKRYKLRFELEKEWRVIRGDRSEAINERANQKASNRIHDDRFMEHLTQDLLPLEKGVLKHHLRYKESDWDKIVANSNKKAGLRETIQETKYDDAETVYEASPPEPIVKSPNKTLDLDSRYFERSPNTKSQKYFDMRPKELKSSLSQASIRTLKTDNEGFSPSKSPKKLFSPFASPTFNKPLVELYRSVNLQSPYERANEPPMNPADKYNQLSVRPNPNHVWPQKSNSLPPLTTTNDSLRYSLVKTGAFKKTDVFS